MTKAQSPQEKKAKKSAKAAQKADRQAATESSTPPAETVDRDIPDADGAYPDPGVIEEQSSTPPQGVQEPAPEPETGSTEETLTPTADADSAPTTTPEGGVVRDGKPKRGRPRKPKQCLDPLKVSVGTLVRFWLPLANAGAKLVNASVSKVYPTQEKGTPPIVELNYETLAGMQCREEVRYIGDRPKKPNQSGAWLQDRNAKWMEFPTLDAPQDEEAPE